MNTRINRLLIPVVLSVLLCPLTMAEMKSMDTAGDTDPEPSINTPGSGLLCWDCWLGTLIAYTFQQQLPGSHDLNSIGDLAPGITVRLPAYVHGAALNDNQYRVDDLDITDPVTGVGAFEISPEVVEQVEIRTGALDADIGRDMGGIFTAHTRSGTNDWHGRLRLDVVNTDWQEDWNDGTYGYRGPDYDYIQPTVTLDGPILRDRLWFLVAYSYYAYDQPYKSIGFYGANHQFPSQLTELDSERSFTHPFAKLTFQPTDAHRMNLTFFSQDYCQENASGDPVRNTPEAFMDIETITSGQSFNWEWQISPNTILTVMAGRSLAELNTLPQKESDDPRDAPFYDTYYGQGYNNGSTWTEEDRERIQLKAGLDWIAGDWFGEHRVIAGVETQQLSREQFRKYPGGAMYVIDAIPAGDWDDPDYFYGETADRSVLLFPGTSESSADYWGIYLMDQWQLSDCLHLEAGVRYEQIAFENDTGDTDVPAWSWGQFQAEQWINTDGSVKNTASMCFDGMLAPRLRLDWDLNGDGKTVVSGFYGRYYNAFDLSLPDMFQPFNANVNASAEETYTGPEWHDMDADGVPDEDYFFDSTNWQRTDEDDPLFTNLIDPDLEPEYTDEIALGIRHQITDEWSAAINYIYRQTNNMVEDAGLFLDEQGNVVWTYRGAVNDDFTGLRPGWDFDPMDDGEAYAQHVYWITNVDGNEREYSSIELSTEYLADHFDLRLYYTWSEAEGATTEAAPGYSGVMQFSGQYDTVATSQNLYGELPWSARHMVRFAGTYWFDLTDWYEMSFGVNAFWHSGYHYSKRSNPPFTYDPSDPYNDLDDPDTWTGRPPYRSYPWYFVEPRGGYELPSHLNVNFSWQNTFSMGQWGSIAVVLDIENLIDNQEVISETDTYNPHRPELFGQASNWYYPRSYRATVKYMF